MSTALLLRRVAMRGCVVANAYPELAAFADAAISQQQQQGGDSGDKGRCTVFKVGALRCGPADRLVLCVACPCTCNLTARSRLLPADAFQGRSA